MYTVLVILIVIAAVLLCGIVFVQESKGGGLSSGFSDNNSLLGVHKTTDFVEKATWSLAGFIVVLSVMAVLIRPNDKVQGGTVAASVDTKAPAAQTNVPGMPSSSAAGVETPAAQTSAPAEATAAPAEAAPAAAETAGE